MSLRSVLVGLAVVMGLALSAQGGVLYWDTNGTTPGAGTTPTGTWGTDTFWTTDATGAITTGAYTPGSDVVFSADSGTPDSSANPFLVTVSGTQAVNSLTFGVSGGTTAAATLSGGIIALGTAAVTTHVNATIASVLDGSSGLTKSGNGTLILTGSNIYTGNTTVSGGALRAVNGMGLPASSILNVAGGVLETSGTFVRTADPDPTPGVVRIDSGNSGFSAVGGELNIDLDGDGTGTGQTLEWGLTAAFRPDTFVLQSPAATHQLTLRNAIDLRGATRTIQVNANVARLTGQVSNSVGTAGITKTGVGTLELAATNNSYTGTTAVNAGALRASDAAGLPTASGLDLNGGVLELTGSFGRALVNSTPGSGQVRIGENSGFAAYGADQIVDLSVGGTPGANIQWWANPGLNGISTLAFGSKTANAKVTIQNVVETPLNEVKTIYVEDNPNSDSDAAAISFVTGAFLNKTGPGTLVINSITGVNGTTFSITAGKLMAGANLTHGSTLLVPQNGGILDVGGQVVTIPNICDDYTGHNMPFINGSVIDSSTGTRGKLVLSENGGFVWVQGSSNTISADVQLNSGTSLTRNFNLDGAAVALNISGQLSDESATNKAGISKSGPGTLTLSGSNIFRGDSTLSQGTLVVAADNALGTGVFNINGGTLQFAGGPRSLGNPTVNLNVDTTITSTDNVTFTGIVHGVDNRALTNNLPPGKMLTLGGALADTNRYWKLLGNGDTTFTGAITGQPTYFIKDGSGTLTFSSSGSIGFTDERDVQFVAGRVVLGASERLGDYINLDFTGSATFDLAGYTETVGYISTMTGATVLSTSAGGKLIFNKNGDTTINATGANTISSDLQLTSSASGAHIRYLRPTNASDSLTISGNISEYSTTNYGKIVKDTAGTLILSGSNTFGGTTSPVLGDDNAFGLRASAGTLVVGSDSALGTGYFELWGCVLQATGTTTTIANMVNFRSSTISGSQGITFSNTFRSGDNYTLTNNLDPGKTLTLANIMETDNRTFTLTGSGDTTVNLIRDYASTTNGFGFTKTGNGKLTLTGTNYFTWPASPSVVAGTVLIQNDHALDFTQNSSTIVLGSLTTSATLDIGGYSPTMASLGNLYNSSIVNTGTATAKLIWGAPASTTSVLYGTNSIATNLQLTGTSGTAYTRTFTMYGTGPTLTISGNVSQGAGNANINKGGPGTLTFAGTSNAYGGTTTVVAGTFELMNTSAAAATNSFGGAIQVGNTTCFEGTVQSTKAGAGSITTTFGGYTARAVATTGNYVVSGGTNGVDNKIVITGKTGFADVGLFFNGQDYAYFDSTNYVRAPIYGDGVTGDTDCVSAGLSLTGSKHNLLTSSLSGQGAVAVQTLKLGGAAPVNLGLVGALTLNNGGLLRGGGGASTISGGAITVPTNPGSSTDFVVRVDSASDSLAISSNFGSDGNNRLVKTGAGTLGLSGNNRFGLGTVAIIGGTVSLDSAGAFGENWRQFFIGGSGGGSAVVGAVSPAPVLELRGNSIGVINLTGYATNALIENSGGGPATITSLNISTQSYFDGVISDGTGGAVSLIKRGTSRLSLTNANTYTGTTGVYGGNLDLRWDWYPVPNSNPIISAQSPLVLAGGILGLQGVAGTAPVQTFNGTTIKEGASNFTLNLNSATSLTLNLGALTHEGGSALNVPSATSCTIKTTTAPAGDGFLGGWVTFNGDWATSAGNGTTAGAISAFADTYTTDTWASGNNTNVTTASTSVSDGAVTQSLRFATSSAKTVTLNGAATIQSGGLLVTSGQGGNSVTINGTGTLTSGSSDLIVHQFNSANNEANALVINTVITGDIGLVKTGASWLTLGAANNYTGPTVVGGGTLKLAVANAIPVNSTVDLSGAVTTAGTINFGALTAVTFGGLTGVNNLALTNSANQPVALTVGGNNQNLTFYGVMSGTGSVIKAGSGTWTLNPGGISAGTQSSYSGTTTVRAGTLEAVYNAPSSGTGVFGNSSSAIQLGDSQTQTSDNVGLMINGPYTIGRPIAVNNYGNVVKIGGSSRFLSTYSGAITLNRDVSLWSADGGQVKFTGAMSGSYGVAKDGPGIATLTAANSYTGTTTINSGVLEANDGVGLPGGVSGSFLRFNGGVLQLSQSFARTVYGGVTGGNGGSVQWGGMGGFAARTADVAVSLNGGAALNWANNGFTEDGLLFGSPTADKTVLWQNPIGSNGANPMTIQVNKGVGTAPEVSMQAAISGSGTLVKNGAGTLELTASNSYGATSVNAGTLKVSSADALPTGGNLTIASAGHVALASGLSHAISLGGLTITSGAGGDSAPAAFGAGLPTPPASAAVSGDLAPTSSAAPTPEPGTIALLAAGAVAALAAWRKRRMMMKAGT